MTFYPDAILPITIRFQSSTAPQFAVQQVQVTSGYRKVNELWSEPLRVFRLVYKRPLVTGALIGQFFEALGGPADEFLLRDWGFWHTASSDDSRPAGESDISNIDMPLINPNLGTNLADGVTTQFHTYVTRTAGSAQRNYRIRHPDPTSVVAAADGNDATAQISSVNISTGVVTFSSAPPFGGSPTSQVMTWGGKFYRAGHFMEDNIAEVFNNFEVNAFNLMIREAKGV